MSTEPEVVISALLGIQLCVPSEWTDEQIQSFADAKNPTGLNHGWKVRKEGHVHLAGCPERVPCEDREGFVHVTVEC